MREYHDLMEHVLRHGVRKDDRTGTGILSVFGHRMRFDLSEGFPTVTTRKLHLKSIVRELLWFLSCQRWRYMGSKRGKSVARRQRTMGPTRNRDRAIQG